LIEEPHAIAKEMEKAGEMEETPPIIPHCTCIGEN
jgi:hypothetical protein